MTRPAQLAGQRERSTYGVLKLDWGSNYTRNYTHQKWPLFLEIARKINKPPQIKSTNWIAVSENKRQHRGHCSGTLRGQLAPSRQRHLKGRVFVIGRVRRDGGCRAPAFSAYPIKPQIVAPLKTRKLLKRGELIACMRLLSYTSIVRDPRLIVLGGGARYLPTQCSSTWVSPKCKSI